MRGGVSEGVVLSPRRMDGVEEALEPGAVGGYGWVVCYSMSTSCQMGEIDWPWPDDLCCNVAANCGRCK